jgi:hypothetical protein
MLDGNATVIPVGRNAPVDPYAVLKKFRTSSQAACAVLTPSVKNRFVKPDPIFPPLH